MFFAILALLAPVTATVPAPAAGVRPYQSLHLELPYTPTIARIDGEDRLVYELHATNFAREPLSVTAIDLCDAVSGAQVARIDPAGPMRRIGAQAGGATEIAPGGRAIFYLSISWTGGDPKPLVHRITLTPARSGQRPASAVIAGGEFTATRPFVAALGAPLRGGPWTAVALPDIDNGHRRFPYAVSGRVRLPGRHAIDWMPARGFVPGTAGRDVAADGSGADVLAVADGEVVTVKNAPAPGAPASVEDETGAMIVLRLPDGRFAFYQHLAPGIDIRVGTRVRRGQVIGRVGSSGHVTQPHLHFHVADRAAPLDGEGLPYRFGAGRIVGRYASHADFKGNEGWQSAVPRPIDGLPPAHAVVLFAAAPI
ncbi:murein DD-endopeptidase MepM/ murein hydrolase activator NlpD [Sphingopyxis italica]|uniref:Murein DD-endopeptidase MepM/ murein hydrolase activator NlpD n=1 Tax=Sphingopyxis italica TaxID=1129133 RepID=A0A7X5XQ20_9SPHN|nr:M23 family metallopeptidase [Sphingopyxis italica]NJB87862.1 murein DD-endopeptidase MepM/ murein hydrolase activator NlpD [Sphingopyxis italica]